MSLTLGAALYYDTDLSADPAPLRRLWEVLADRSLTQWSGSVERVGRKQTLDLAKLERVVSSGTAASVCVEGDGLLVLSHALAASRLRQPLVPRHWTYDTVICVAAERGPNQALVDAIVAFGAAVRATAGIVYWTRSFALASGIATGGLAGALTPAEERAVRDSHDLSNHWGRILRGPEWGTFLGAVHVAQLGDALPAGMVPLASGGAFVQVALEAVPLGDPSLALDELRDALAALMR